MRTTTTPAPTRGALARLALLLLSLTVLGAVLASPASAHTDLVSASLSPGSTVRPGASDLTLTFASPLIAEGTQILVQDSSGTNHASAASTLGPQSRVQLESLSTPGTYSVVYRAVAGDGHPIIGSYEFRVAGSAAGDATPASTSGVSAPSGTIVAAAVSETPAGRWSPVRVWLVAVLGASSLAALLIAGARRRPEDERVPARDERP